MKNRNVHTRLQTGN